MKAISIIWAVGAEGLFWKRMVNTGRGERERERYLFAFSPQKDIFEAKHWTPHSIGLTFHLMRTHFLSENSLTSVIERLL